MFRRILFILPILSVAFFVAPSFASAEAIDLESLVVAAKTQAETTKEVTTPEPTTDAKEIFKSQDDGATTKGETEQEKERQRLTQSLNYLLIEAYKGKIDRIFGNLQDNISRYPADIQVKILKQVGNSVGSKIELLDEKGDAISANRKEILSQVLQYIKSLVQANIAKVMQEK